MSRHEKVLARIMAGTSDANIDFDQLCGVLRDDLGFSERIRGSHHIFTKSGVTDRINLQRDGRHAKPYQVEQVRTTLRTNGLA